MVRDDSAYIPKAALPQAFPSSSRIWPELNEKAFRRLGGSLRIAVLDNLTEGVHLRSHLNPTLSRWARPLRAVALPCRIKDPDRKARRENPHFD